MQNELLKEFLSQARRHKQEQMDQIGRELRRIDKDVERANEISAQLALSSRSAVPCCPSSSCSAADPLIKSARADESSAAGDSNHTVDSSANASQSSDNQGSSSSCSISSSSGINKTSNGSLSAQQNRDLRCSVSSATLSQHSQYTLSEKKIKMMAYYDVLESCYLGCRSEPFSSASSAARPPVASASLNAGPSTRCSSSDPDDAYVDLSEFSHTLHQFTSYNGLRPLATLCYTPDLFSGSSIVSSIEFDKENEYFAIAGVTKKIKLFDYCSVVSASAASDKNDIHYPLVEMECNSKISCVSWSSYMKSMMASADYEGTVIVWDAFTAQKLRVLQEHEKRCWSVDFNKIDTKLVASGSDDAKVKLWSTNVHHSVATLAAKANVCCVKFNPSKRYHLAFGSADHSVHYYDLRNTKCAISVFKGHEKAVSYVKFLSESQLVSASTDSQLKLWSLTENHCLESFRGHINEKNFVGLATSGEFIACGSENNSLYVYFKGVPRHMLSFHFDSQPTSVPSDADSAKVLVSSVRLLMSACPNILALLLSCCCCCSPAVLARRALATMMDVTVLGVRREELRWQRQERGGD